MINYESLEVGLGRVEERLIALDEKFDLHLEQNKRVYNDVDSLKQSRSKFKGMFVALIAFAGWLGIDRFFI